MTCSLLFIGCKKDKTAGDSSSLSPGKCQISCTVSGTTSGSFSSVDVVSTATKSGSIMNISGATASIPIQLMMFLIPTGFSTGSHNLATSDDFAVTYTKDSNGWAAGNVGDDFTINITKNDGTYFDATFSGTLTNDTDHTTVTVSNGKIAARF